MAWSNFASITLDHTKVPNTDQANYAFPFSGVFPALKSTANGGTVTSSSGYDIIFAADSAGATPYRFQRVNYDPATGRFEGWVKVPTVSHTTDTQLYILYGNSAVTTDQQASTATWESGFSGVYHLGINGALSVADSTANGYNGVSGNNSWTLPSATSGQIGTGIALTGTQGIYLGNVFNLPSSSAITISAWIYSTSGGAIFGASANFGLEFRLDSSRYLNLLRQAITQYTNSSSQVPANTWVHVGVACSATGGFNYYLNGVNIGGGAGANSFQAVGQTIGITSNNENFHGSIDELRVSNVARSADWFATEYNSQFDPKSFFSTSLGNAAPAVPIIQFIT